MAQVRNNPQFFISRLAETLPELPVLPVQIRERLTVFVGIPVMFQMRIGFAETCIDPPEKGFDGLGDEPVEVIVW